EYIALLTKRGLFALPLNWSEMPLVPPLKNALRSVVTSVSPFGSSFYSLFRMLYPRIQKNSQVLYVACIFLRMVVTFSLYARIFQSVLRIFLGIMSTLHC